MNGELDISDDCETSSSYRVDMVEVQLQLQLQLKVMSTDQDIIYSA